MRQLPSEEIVMTHYNKSIGLLNLENSMYSFLMRAHTSTINRITYNPLVNKVVTISKDNSIRIWQYVAHSNGPFQFRLQEQYEFVITGEEMVDLASGLEGRQEDLLRVIVGGDSGKLRVINIEKYSIEQ
jgi:WD40 repeat protein